MTLSPATRRFGAVLLAGAVVIALALAFAAWSWERGGPATDDTIVMIDKGSSIASAGRALEKAGIIRSATNFRRLARVFGGDKPIQAGEYKIPREASMARVLQLLQSGDVLLYQLLVSEGMSALQVYERMLAEPRLSGTIDVPAEGSVLPETYTFTRGEQRQAVLDRMQNAMTRTLEEEWGQRAEGLPLASPEQAIILASIVEKETSKKKELRRVAGVYINRLNQGIKLQADPTVIYPVTKGKPLGRRIRQSELDAANDYNTYVIEGLPKGPIANPGRAAIAATLNPEQHEYIFFVADGTGGHVFTRTYAEHREKVADWRALRAAKGF
jgi:UPF0755 protein